jgi:tetratricopeptide (TPR) repeat protein
MNLNRLYWLIIVGVVIVLYARILTHEHVLDDQALIPNQPALQAPFDVGNLLLGRYWGELRTQDTLYRPFTIWTLALNHSMNRWAGLAGEHQAIYRLTNVVLHALVSVLVCVFVRWLGFGAMASLWSGLLFAVLPIHTEVVAAAVNRSEILVLGFGLAFLMCRPKQWVLAGLFLLLALWSKESGLLFLPVALWFDVSVAKNTDRAPFWHWIGYAGVVGLWWISRSAALGDALQAVVMLDNPMAMASVPERVLTALSVQWKYLILQTVPIGLSTDYSYAQIPLVHTLWTIDVMLMLGFLGGVGWGIWRFWNSRVPFLLGSYVLLFALTANVLVPIGTVMAERLAYAPSIVLCVLAGAGLASLSRDWMWRVGVVLVLIYSGITLERLAVWKNARTFYAAQVVSAPNSAKAHYSVAHEVYQPSGRLDQAEEHYRRALEILPNYPDAWNNLGVIKKDKGDVEGAITDYRTALQWHRGHVASRVNLGQAYQDMGETDRAIKAYLEALGVDSTHAIAGNNLAVLYAQQGDTDSAQIFFQRVLRHWPAYVPAQKNYQLLLDALDKP